MFKYILFLFFVASCGCSSSNNAADIRLSLIDFDWYAEIPNNQSSATISNNFLKLSVENTNAEGVLKGLIRSRSFYDLRGSFTTSSFVVSNTLNIGSSLIRSFPVIIASYGITRNFEYMIPSPGATYGQPRHYDIVTKSIRTIDASSSSHVCVDDDGLKSTKNCNYLFYGDTRFLFVDYLGDRSTYTQNAGAERSHGCEQIYFEIFAELQSRASIEISNFLSDIKLSDLNTVNCKPAAELVEGNIIINNFLVQSQGFPQVNAYRRKSAILKFVNNMFELSNYSDVFNSTHRAYDAKLSMDGKLNIQAVLNYPKNGQISWITLSTSKAIDINNMNGFLFEIVDSGLLKN